MSDKPREWVAYIFKGENERNNELFKTPKAFRPSKQEEVRVIEYSAYEAVKKQMDHNAKILNECVETERHIAVKFAMERDAAIKERDEALEKQTQLKIAVDKATGIISAERSRSTKMVEERDEARAALNYMGVAYAVKCAHSANLVEAARIVTAAEMRCYGNIGGDRKSPHSTAIKMLSDALAEYEEKG